MSPGKPGSGYRLLMVYEYHIIVKFKFGKKVDKAPTERVRRIRGVGWISTLLVRSSPSAPLALGAAKL
jgi:hypothetical protein